jgi:ketosteroid isomerase-like protein
MAHPNEQVARDATAALSRGDMEGFLSHHTDDVVLHFPGNGPVAGDYRGRDGLANLFRKQGEILDSPPQVQNHDVLANDEHAVILNNVRATRNGRTLDQQQVVVLHMRDGKIAEIWLQFSDQAAMDEFGSS